MLLHHLGWRPNIILYQTANCIADSKIYITVYNTVKQLLCFLYVKKCSEITQNKHINQRTLLILPDTINTVGGKQIVGLEVEGANLI